MPNIDRLMPYACGCLAVFLAAAALSCSVGRKPAPFDVNSAEYRDAVTAFSIGLAGLQVGDDVRAEARLTQLTEIAAAEPVGWADLGLLALRHREYDRSATLLEKALALAPDNGRIHGFLGLLESARGRPSEAIARFREAAALDPDDLESRYSLAKELSRQGDDAGAQRVVEELLERRPDNLEALAELTRIAAKRGDTDAFARTVDRLAKLSSTWPPDVQERVRTLQSAGADPRAAATSIAFLRNALIQMPEYRRSCDEVTCPPGVIAHPLDAFLWLPVPESSPAPPDETLRFTAQPVQDAAPGAWTVAQPIILTSDGAPTIVVATDDSIRIGERTQLPFPGVPTQNGVVSLDANFDFRTDVLLAGSKGLRLFVQSDAGAFVDATPKAKLTPDIVRGAYAGAWAADLESDGDLDIVLARVDGPPLELRNNGDGTYAAVQPFAGVDALRAFVWTDLDDDGDADAAMLDGRGALHVFTNERLGQFAERPAVDGPYAALAAADADGDGRVDLVAFRTDGAVVRLSDTGEGASWETAEIGRLAGPATGDCRILAADYDNNGSTDLAVISPSGSSLWLGASGGAFAPLDVLPRERIVAAGDLTGDGRVDLLGVSPNGRPLVAANNGTKDYQWMELRPRARNVAGDRRVNSYGIGGQAEVRAGLLFQTQPIESPLVHIGLGKHPEADVVRITWPNGALQAEFELKVDTPVVFDQRLEGSCPWLFAFDGERMAFVTDLIWRSPLGLRINAQDTGRVMQTEDWVKIRGDQLAARDGVYDLRVTAELWETHFFDRLALKVVDHPAGTEIAVDERFAVPPPELSIYATGPLHPVAEAVDDLGQVVTHDVQAVDGTYLDTFGRGEFQGITRDHFVEIALDDAPPDRPLLLVANGWIHPTDSSINVAVGQGLSAPPRGLSLEVPDGRGGWVVARPNLGFPEGKNKTILVPLDGVFRPGTPRRVRLRTNLEIYWDSISWAESQPETRLAITELDAATADLAYRGFSVVRQANPSSPELPDYNLIGGTTERWADLVGFYTRFGDVRELLGAVDDRYVIMNAGDELVLRFPAPPPPPAGWVRDFVMVGDGWVKDGNFNTTFSKTVLPLPLHGRPDYTTPPGRLNDDPAYRLHPDDWVTYHTRYVTPDEIRSALRR